MSPWRCISAFDSSSGKDCHQLFPWVKVWLTEDLWEPEAVFTNSEEHFLWYTDWDSSVGGKEMKSTFAKWKAPVGDHFSWQK